MHLPAVCLTHASGTELLLCNDHLVCVFGVLELVLHLHKLRATELYSGPEIGWAAAAVVAAVAVSAGLPSNQSACSSTKHAGSDDTLMHGVQCNMCAKQNTGNVQARRAASTQEQCSCVHPMGTSLCDCEQSSRKVISHNIMVCC